MKVEFYEKPGCINGEKQKAILTKSGNHLKCINILEFPWTRQSLMPFVEGKSPAMMMNSTAPAVKKGEIRPSELSFDEAVSLMIANPILIKRPLIVVSGLHIQGFDDERLKPYLGDWDGAEDVTACPNLTQLSCDEQKR